MSSAVIDNRFLRDCSIDIILSNSCTTGHFNIMLEYFTCVRIIKEPTGIGYNIRTLIDIIIVNNSELIVKCSVQNVEYFYHGVASCIIDCDSIKLYLFYVS